MKMKKLLALSTAAVMAVSLCACGGDDKKEPGRREQR